MRPAFFAPLFGFEAPEVAEGIVLIAALRFAGMLAVAIALGSAEGVDGIAAGAAVDSIIGGVADVAATGGPFATKMT